MEQHRLPGQQLVLGTGKQWGLGAEPHWEEAQQQGGLLVINKNMQKIKKLLRICLLLLTVRSKHFTACLSIFFVINQN